MAIGANRTENADIDADEKILNVDFSGAAEPPASLNRLAMRLANVPDEDFIDALTIALYEELDFDLVLIGRLNQYTNMIRTLSLYHEGQMNENIIYSLADTPCARALENNVCVYPDNVCELFPRDQMLIDMQIRGYVGIALFSESGHAIGIIVGVSKNEIANVKLHTSIFEFFRERVARRLETAEKLERYHRAFSGSREGYWDWDIETGNMVLSESIGNMLGFSPAEAPEDLAEIENLLHKDDRANFKAFIQDHLKTDATHDMDFRLRAGDGTYRTIRLRVHKNVNASGRAVRLIGSLTLLAA